MTPEHRDLLRDLLGNQRVLSLGVLVDGEPHVGLLPFAVKPDWTACYVHASSLARHSKGLTAGAPFSLLIHAPDLPELDPLQVPRVTIDGSVVVVEDDTPAYEAGKTTYLEKFPSAGMPFQLGDFTLYELPFEGGRLVAGFAQAVTLRPEHVLALGVAAAE